MKQLRSGDDGNASLSLRGPWFYERSRPMNRDTSMNRELPARMSDQALHEILSRLVKAFEPERVYSLARKPAAMPDRTVTTTCSSWCPTLHLPNGDAAD